MGPGVRQTVPEWAASELLQPCPWHSQHAAKPHHGQSLPPATVLVLRRQLIRSATSNPQESSGLANGEEVRKGHAQDQADLAVPT
jgi:hypothetical protein